MEFFNQKEEVIDIQLTQYGKRRLAAGKFKPIFYAFFDKDVLYNSEFGGITTEHQNNSETRIKSETPRLKAQYNFIGVDTQIKELKEIESKGKDTDDLVEKEILQDVENKFFGDNTSVGTTKLNNRYNPSWDIKFYNEHLKSAVLDFTGSGPVKRIPQLEAELVYKSYSTNKPDFLNDQIDVSYLSSHHDEEENIVNLDNGTQIFIKDDFILLGIEEKNTDFFNENFEIEVFLEETDSKGRVKLTPLKFTTGGTEEEGTVDHYLAIEVDEEIDDQILCKYVQEEDKKSVYVKQIFTCDDDPPPIDEIDIYDGDNIGDFCE